MADDLIDLRAKITPETHRLLTAISLATGEDISAIVRKVLSGFTASRVHEAETILRLARNEGTRGGSVMP